MIKIKILRRREGFSVAFASENLEMGIEPIFVALKNRGYCFLLSDIKREDRELSFNVRSSRGQKIKSADLLRALLSVAIATAGK